MTFPMAERTEMARLVEVHSPADLYRALAEYLASCLGVLSSKTLSMPMKRELDKGLFALPEQAIQIVIPPMGKGYFDPELCFPVSISEHLPESVSGSVSVTKGRIIWRLSYKEGAPTPTLGQCAKAAVKTLYELGS